jgi:hypothetical protein
MAQNKIHIDSDNITEWLASTGFIFPRTEAELDRFNKLYEESEIQINEPDIERIMNIDKQASKTRKPELEVIKEVETFRMVARNGDSLPPHILDKIKKNQIKKKDDTAD